MDHLLKAKGDTAQLQRDAAAYGITLEAHHLESERYRLWADLWPAVNVFQRCQTQWRSGPTGLLGLDYGAVFQMAPLLGVELDGRMMEDVQAMELHARDQLNRRLQRRT